MRPVFRPPPSYVRHRSNCEKTNLSKATLNFRWDATFFTNWWWHFGCWCNVCRLKAKLSAKNILTTPTPSYKTHQYLKFSYDPYFVRTAGYICRPKNECFSTRWAFHVDQMESVPQFFRVRVNILKNLLLDMFSLSVFCGSPHVVHSSVKLINS